MNMKMLLLFTALTIFNTILQTVKSLCTVKCKTRVSALVNAVAYGMYTYVIIFTTSEGIPTFVKALITAVANYIGVYIANSLFAIFFKNEVNWKVEISIPSHIRDRFIEQLNAAGLEYYVDGFYNTIESAYKYGINNSEWTAMSVFCPNKEASRTLKEILPMDAKYNISECIKRL